MVKSSPEKLAAALRANLKRRKGSDGPTGPEDGRVAKPTPQASPAQTSPEPPPKPPKKSA